MREVRGAALAALTIVALAGCDTLAPSPAATSAGAGTATATVDDGLAAQSAQAIATDALTAHTKARYAHVRGLIALGNDVHTIDVRIDYQTVTAVMTVRFADHMIEVRRIGDTLYVKADAAWWKKVVSERPKSWTASPDQIASRLDGKFLAAPIVRKAVLDPPEFALHELDWMRTVDTALSSFVEGPAAKGSVRTVNGTTVMTLYDLNEEREAAENAGTLYVRAVGQRYPVRIEVPRGYYDFLDYGEPTTVEKPPAAATVDLDTLI